MRSLVRGRDPVVDPGKDPVKDPGKPPVVDPVTDPVVPVKPVVIESASIVK